MSTAATAPKQTFQGSGSIGLRRTSCVIDLAARSHFGPSRRFAATLDVGRSRTEADIGLDFMSTRPSSQVWVAPERREQLD